jgi:hypothetical protein
MGLGIVGRPLEARWHNERLLFNFEAPAQKRRGTTHDLPPTSSDHIILAAADRLPGPASTSKLILQSPVSEERNANLS